MNKLALTNNKFALTLRQKSPEILTGVSIASGIGAIVCGVRAGMKLQDVLDDFKIEIGYCQEKYADDPQTLGKEMTRVYTRYLGKIALLFAPAIGLEAASIASGLSAKKIVDGRLAVATTAYAALSTTFNEVMNKIKEKYGEEAYYDLRFGDKVEEYIDMKEDGSAVEVRKPLAEREPDPTVRLLAKDEHEMWKNDEDPSSILSMLQAIQSDWNRNLKQDGIVFLNQILKVLKYPPTEFGQRYGWVYNPDDPDSSNYISFGLLNDPESWRNFIKGRDPWLWLNFNCDPRPIIQLLP